MKNISKKIIITTLVAFLAVPSVAFSNVVYAEDEKEQLELSLEEEQVELSSKKQELVASLGDEELLTTLEEKVKDGLVIEEVSGLSKELKEEVPEELEEDVINYLNLYKLNQVNLRMRAFKEEHESEEVTYSLADYPAYEGVIENYKKYLDGESVEGVDKKLADSTKEKGELEFTLYDTDYNKTPELLLRLNGTLRAIYYIAEEGVARTLPEVGGEEEWDLAIREDYQVFATKLIDDTHGSWTLFDFNYTGDKLTATKEWTYEMLDTDSLKQEYKFINTKNKEETNLEEAKLAFGLEETEGRGIVKTIDLETLNWLSINEDTTKEISRNQIKTSASTGRLIARQSEAPRTMSSKKEEGREVTRTSEDKEAGSEETGTDSASGDYPYAFPIENIGRPSGFTPAVNSADVPAVVEVHSSNGSCSIYPWENVPTTQPGDGWDGEHGQASVYEMWLDYIPTASIEVYSISEQRLKTVNVNTRVTLGNNVGGQDIYGGYGVNFYIYYNNRGGVSIAIPNQSLNVPGSIVELDQAY